METERKLRGLILSMRELNIAQADDPERFVMDDGLTELLDGLYRYGVQIINLDMFAADSPKKLQVILELHRLQPEHCLLLASTDRVLSIIDRMEMASLGYLNPQIPGQKLSQAKMLVENFEEVDFHFLERVYQRKHGIPWTVIETRRCFLREMTLEETITLASLIQSEAADEAQMFGISSVFHNRLNNSSAYPHLETDPATKYVEEVIKPNIEAPNQEMYDAYNTKVCNGLPVGPISSPGAKAIEAALNPESTGYYFFVHNVETGECFYATTYEQHQANCRRLGIANS